MVLNLLGALVDNQELVHGIENLGALAQRTNVVDAVLHLVHGGNLHGCLAGLHVGAGLDIAQPICLDQLEVGGA